MRAVLREVRALREDQQADSMMTHARIAALETALMRSSGLEKRDPSFLMRRPAVQRALRTCATLHAAMLDWRKAARKRMLLTSGWQRMYLRRLYSGWTTWLEILVKSMRRKQLLQRARQIQVVKAINTWRYNVAKEAAAEAASGSSRRLLGFERV